MRPLFCDAVPERRGVGGGGGNSSGYLLRIAGFLHPSRDVTLTVQHTPHIDVI
jgi:hypothetical protein